ncbi:ribosome-associated protein YbcJ [Martelella alba]|uniref:Ribosome-associated protein YbcJ n=1 Tax=Martelella alba TaxID=2590451 RepID=A0ABY2SNU7_9HYPH|nr:ribosome-associated protein YbcJ [Martelella alba]TKI06233.1 ribosome-associated protein YbcJ [Martelella alba]
MDTFSLAGHPHIALCDLLKFLGWCPSGAAAKIVIDDGQVTVDGMVETRKRCKIQASQQVAYHGQVIKVIA